MKMNAYEIEVIEKTMRANYRLPLSYTTWADIEHQARRARAQAAGEVLGQFFGAVAGKVAAFARQVRSIAAQCTGARLRHDH
jgi:hypothetical protein